MIGQQELQNLVLDLQRRVAALERGRFYELKAPLTSTAWDSDTFSTTSPTLLDLSAVFGVPAGVRRVLVRLACKDSGSAGGSGYYVYLSPTDAPATAPMVLRPSGLPNNYWIEGIGEIPCTADGDLWYAIGASGVNTMTIKLEIWGWWM